MTLVVRYQIVPELVSETVELVVAFRIRKCLCLAVRSYDDERIDVAVSAQIVHDLLDDGFFLMKAPLALGTADTVTEVEHIVLL